jgi:hypothetical protein
VVKSIDGYVRRRSGTRQNKKCACDYNGVLCERNYKIRHRKAPNQRTPGVVAAKCGEKSACHGDGHGKNRACIPRDCDNEAAKAAQQGASE